MKIGNVKLRSRILAAPMAGVMDLSMRILATEFGAGLVFTELISAEGIVRGQRRTTRYITCHPDEMPLGVQIFGKNPSTMAPAAERAQNLGASLIDINMGCPVKKVAKQGAGASLMKDPDLAKTIVEEVRRAVTIPVTVKIRAGWDQSSINFVEVGKMVEDAGADAVTLHPRVATDFLSGKANWERIGELARALSIPVIGSGDIQSYNEALERLEESGAEFVMIGRAVMGKPWIFMPEWEPRTDEILSVIERHIELLTLQYGEVNAVPIIRRHVSYYIKAKKGAVETRRKLMEMKDINEIVRHVQKYISG